MPSVGSLYPAGATRGTTATVTINGKPGDQPLSVWCSRDDIQIAVADDKKTLEVTIPADAEPGVFWLRLYNAEGSAGLRPFVVGLHPEVNESEPNNRLQEAGQIEGPMVVANGVLSSGEDVDTYAVPLKAEQTLVAAVAANQTLGSPMDGVLQLLSPDGFVLAQNDDDQELDPRLVFTAPADGIYYVRTFAFPADPNQSIRLYSSSNNVYRLTLSTGPFADRTWPVAITSGSSSSVKLEGWNLGDGFADVAVDALANDRIASIFDPALANAGIVRVVSQPVIVEPPNDSEPLALELPVSVSGRIEAADEVDEYRFTAMKGQQLLFEIESRGLGYPLDPVLSLLGPDGKALGEADDASRGVEDTTLTATIAADGEHRIRVFDRFGHGGPRYVYLLTARPAEPSVELSVAADAYTLKRDAPLEIEVQIARAHGYAHEVEITAVDLPAGVKVTPATSKNEGDSAKTVKLTLEAGEGIDKPGTFRIVGKPTGSDDSSELTATAALSDFGTETPQLWLNVPAPAEPDPADDAE